MKYLFLSGPRAVGKSYTVNLITQKHNISMIDTGPIMRYYHKKLAPDTPIHEWVCNLELQYGPEITCYMLAKQLRDKMKDTNTDKIIIVGFRELRGIKYLIDILKTDDYGVLYVDSPEELLYNNYISRINSKNDDKKETFMTQDEFSLFLQQEQEEGLTEIKEFSQLETTRTNYIVKTRNDATLYKTILEIFNEKIKDDDNELYEEFNGK